ncbi:MAG TPA: hypothetical protein VGL86_25075 [Polyangia bacterium]|jgi:hypothetical protein
MNRTLLATAAAVVFIGGGAAAFLLLRRPPLPKPSPRIAQESAHAAGIDRSMAAVRALHDAPVGQTPCESAYNAFKASDEVAKTMGAKAVVLKLAPRDEFLRRCDALPKELQTCLVPDYLSKHRDECEKARPAAGVLDPLVELRHATEPQRDEPASTPR